MPRIITLNEKLAVIDDWLNGESRNYIAIKRSMGSGTVYNILQEWRIGIGVQKADRLREIALQLKKTGLSVTECAIGLRTWMIFKKYGIKENDDQEQLVYFLKEIYTRCQVVGFTPQQVFDYLSDILKFSSEISISQIPQFMKKRIEEKEKLESVVQKLSKKINELSDIAEEKEREIERFSKMEDVMTKTYQSFAISRDQLKQYGIRIEDIDQFVKCVVGIAKENYNHVQILKKITDYENLEKNSRYYNDQVNSKKDELAKLNKDLGITKNILNCSKIKVDNLNELDIMGFGINELRMLNNMLNEIGGGNNQSFDEIRKEFFADVKNYEEVIGSRKEIDRLKYELKNLEAQTMKEREKYNAYPKILESLIRLSSAGISEDDIVKIDKILSMSDYYYQEKDKPFSKETLRDDLHKYGNLKLAIKNLEDIKTNLKSNKRRHDNQIKKEIDTVKKTKRKKSVKA